MPAAYAPGRSGQYADDILKGFTGVLQVDGYAGYNRLIQPDRAGPAIQPAYCWAQYARRSLTFDRGLELVSWREL